MSEYILSINNVGKCYFEWSIELKRILSWFGIPFKPAKENWVLKNFNLEVKKGEIVGIIGPNGAGKSTLLKLVAGTLDPSEGSINKKGKIGAILELGVGFHPDRSGKDNCEYSLSLHGYRNNEITGLLKRIEDFSEIGNYFTKNFRTYSSGMKMRIAFAVVTAKRPDILIIDEALSVGDTYFQSKCFKLIREFQKLGSSIIFVSHDKNAIQTICDKVIFINQGRIENSGKPDNVIDYYNAFIGSINKNDIKVIDLDHNKKVVSGNGKVQFRKIVLYDKYLNDVTTIKIGQNIILYIEIDILEKVNDLVIGFQIKDRLGRVVFGTNSFSDKSNTIKSYKKKIFKFKFPINIGQGNYTLSVAAHSSFSHTFNNYEWIDHALVFTIISNKNKINTEGIAWMPVKIEID